MEKETFKQLIEGSEQVLVDFYATWCGPCQRMHPILEDLKKQMGENIRIAKIDVDAHSDLAEQYRIQSVPTFIFFKNGELKWRESGAIPMNVLKNKIESTI